MAKKKDFTKKTSNSYVTDGEKSSAFHSDGVAPVKPVAWAANPKDMKVYFDENASTRRSFDFSPWYGVSIDTVTRSCHQAVSILLGERNREHSTISNYCTSGMNKFLPFCQTWAAALQRPMTLEDIEDNFIGSFLSFLSDSDVSETSKKNAYTATKGVLVKVGELGWINAADLFPKNPYPNSNRKSKGQKALSSKERQRVVYQLKADLNSILEGEDPLDSYELSVCMLAIAARSGMNPTPLMELPLNCVLQHPLKANRKLLVSYKRRGNATHIQALRKSESLELVKTVMPDVEVIIETIIRCNEVLRSQSQGYEDRLFVFMKRGGAGVGTVTVVTQGKLFYSINQWVDKHQLKDDSGNRLKLNIMRLRKTFENRIWMLSGQDPWVTAKMSGHSMKVSNDHYLEVPKEAEKNFGFMGEVLTQVLLSDPKVITLPSENTPVSKCRDTLNGQFTPHDKAEHCTNFLDCVRCRSFVVTEEDLWKLFSFYWLLVSERSQMGARKWGRNFAHIIRIIDRDISVSPKFDADVVKAAKAKAKEQPHPFWKTREQLEGIYDSC